MLRQENNLGVGESKISGALSGLMAVILMLGLSRTGCVVEVLLGAVAHAAMAVLPEVLLKGWSALHTGYSSSGASICGELVRLAGSCWPMLASLIMKR